MAFQSSPLITLLIVYLDKLLNVETCLIMRLNYRLVNWRQWVFLVEVHVKAGKVAHEPRRPTQLELIPVSVT